MLNFKENILLTYYQYSDNSSQKDQPKYGSGDNLHNQMSSAETKMGPDQVLEWTLISGLKVHPNIDL